MRKKRSGSGPLTTVLVWLIVKPLELMFKGLVALLSFRSRSNTEHPGSNASQYWSFTALGWHNTVHGPLYFDGVNWYAPDGRPLF